MAGEVRSELVIRLEGGVGGSTGGGVSSQAPVSRRFDLSPAQRATNFAAERQLRFSREMAMDISRDKDAVRELETAMLRQEALGELEVSSRRRARESFARRVRDGRGTAEEFNIDRLNRQLARKGNTAAKRILRGWGSAVVAGLTPQILIPEDGGAMGAFARIGMSTVSGGAFAGLHGAAGAFMLATLSEITRSLNNRDAEFENLRKEIARNRKELQQLLEDSFDELKEAAKEREQDFEREIKGAVYAEFATKYRENRFERSNLVN